jgi:putative addiction module component (TIGR02574 family)
MTAKAERLLEEALRLSEASRAELASTLIRSLDEEVDIDADAAWSVEIDRRVAQLDAGEVKTIPWRKVQEKLLKARRARRRRR